MNIIRQIGVILLLPLYLVLGEIVSLEITRLTGIWVYYIYAIVFPTIGLVCTKIIAPKFKIYNITFVYIIGIVSAYIFVYPAQYPESHEFSYKWTYRPFLLIFVWASVLTAVLVIHEKYRNKPLA